MDNTNENMTEDKDINKNNNGNSDDYEKICFVCRRPESRAGKMIVMPNNIYICQDCMQRTFDSINSSGINYEDMMKMSNMPGITMGIPMIMRRYVLCAEDQNQELVR